MAKTQHASPTEADIDELIATLKKRFDDNTQRHKGVQWQTVENRLREKAGELGPLAAMESTGGEPDVTAVDKKTGVITFTDCSAESPKGRRSISYDPAAIASRKEHKPAHSAVGMAAEMGIELLTEEQYNELQKLGTFDVKTSSWVRTPDDIRSLGGAIFCDKRYGRVFTYHNGAESYYAARGFRGMFKI